MTYFYPAELDYQRPKTGTIRRLNDPLALGKGSAAQRYRGSAAAGCPLVAES
jgi:hypothetical protein